MSDDQPLSRRPVRRALAKRYASYLDEVNRCIAAGVAVMQRTGNFAPAVRDVIAEAGLSNQAFYRLFPSKEDLLLAIIDAGTRQFDDYLKRRMSHVTDPVDRLREWVRGFAAQAISPVAAAATRPFVIPSARLLDRFPAEIRAIEEQLTAPLSDVLADGTAAHLFRADLDATLGAILVYDVVNDWLQRQLSTEELAAPAAIQESAAQLEDFVVAAVSASTAATKR